MHTHVAAVGARVVAHKLFQRVEPRNQSFIAVDADVLIPGIPVECRSSRKFGQREDLLAVM
jgi:hypothetical protein